MSNVVSGSFPTVVRSSYELYKTMNSGGFDKILFPRGVVFTMEGNHMPEEKIEEVKEALDEAADKVRDTAKPLIAKIAPYAVIIMTSQSLMASL